MKILITNDDGINSKGIKVLENIAKQFTNEIIVIAPLENQSGKSRAITLYDNIELKQISNNHYACLGTPADCVILALNLFYKEQYPDFIFSGINHGLNVADDVGYSGTIAAAFEGGMHGIKSIAFSQSSVKTENDFSPSIKHGRRVVEEILKLKMPKKNILNVNFPSSKLNKVLGIRNALLDKHKIGDEIKSISNSNKFKIGQVIMKNKTKVHSDRWWLKKGYITFTPLLIDFTDYKFLPKIKDINF